MKIVVEIGGYRVLIEEPRDRACFFWPHVRFEQFTGLDSTAPDITMRVELVKRLPPLAKGPRLFTSGETHWQLYEDADGYLLESCLAQSGVLFMQAHISADFSDVRVALREVRPKSSTRSGWSPPALMNPLLEIVLQEKLARDGGALMHSSAVLVEGEVLLFFGPSGAGKSTIAEFFLSQGFTVLNDERVIVRRQHQEFRAFGTPWPGSSYLYSAAQGRLRQVFSIRQGRAEHVLEPITPRVMVTRLLQESYLPHWDAEGMTRTVEFFTALSDTYGCMELTFRQSPDLVAFLTERVLAGAH